MQIYSLSNVSDLALSQERLKPKHFKPESARLSINASSNLSSDASSAHASKPSSEPSSELSSQPLSESSSKSSQDLSTQSSASSQGPNPNFGRSALFDDEADMQLPLRGIDLGLVLCHCCGRLNPQPKLNSSETEAHFKNDVLKSEALKCERCHAPLHQRKTASLERTLAFLIAATILYIPANILPMTITESILGYQQDTIMSGVIYFWHNGDYFVASVIFMASIFIPLLKLVILALLLAAVYLQSAKRIYLLPAHCAILYRIVEFIGRWSMIDVFVVALLAALIQIHSLATILAGAGSVAFGAVVVLTMCASLSFDPRIIWDNYAQAQKNKRQIKPFESTHDLNFPYSNQEK